VACLWTHRLDAGPPNPVLPDGCSDLIWRAGDSAFVAGPDTGPETVDLLPDTLLVGLRFRPGAGAAGLGVPLAEVRDQRVDLADLDPRAAQALPGELSPDAAARALVDLVAERLDGADPDPAVAEAVDLLADPRADLAGVGRSVGIGERQLRRRFLDAVGYGPKTLQRVLRFRAFLAAEGSLAEAAAACGYADQAHLNRECRDLAGQTPAELRH